jgi:integrase
MNWNTNSQFLTLVNVAPRADSPESQVADSRNEGFLTTHRLRPHFGSRIARSLTTADFVKYREEHSTDLTQATLNRHMAYLRSGYHTGMKRMTPPLVDFVIPYFPMESESDNVRQGFIEYDGYVKIRAALTASLRPLFTCGYHVSTRRREIKDLLWSQVDLKDNVIILEKRNTKNKEGRALPVYGDMIEALRDQKKLRDAEFPDCPYVFFWHTCDRAIGHGGARMVSGEPIKRLPWPVVEGRDRCRIPRPPFP